MATTTCPEITLCTTKGLLTHEVGRGHATPHTCMLVETTKCWWLLKIEPNAWAGGKGSCVVYIDFQAVGVLKFLGIKLYSLAKGFGPFLRGVWAGFRKREGSIFSNHQHFTVSTGICGVACPLPAFWVDKPLVQQHWPIQNMIPPPRSFIHPSRVVMFRSTLETFECPYNSGLYGEPLMGTALVLFPAPLLAAVCIVCMPLRWTPSTTRAPTDHSST